MNPWRVERAGSATGGYGRGWVAMNTHTGTGAWKPTWAEAMAFACQQAFEDAVASA